MKQYSVRKKLMAMLLVCALIFVPFAQSSIAMGDERQAVPTSLAEKDRPEIVSAEQVKEAGHVQRLYEEETDLYSVIFENSDATRTMYLYQDPVKYVDASGNIKDKSNTLNAPSEKALSAKYAYVNSDNDVNVYFPKKLSAATGVLLSSAGYNIELIPLDAFDASVKTSAKRELSAANSVYYNDVFGKNTVLRYSPMFDGFKEDIILLENTGNEFSFLLKTGGLTPVIENGHILLLDKKGEQVGLIGDIVVFDSSEDRNSTYNNYYAVKESGNAGEYILSLNVDKAFLEDENTIYPVFVDPTITINVSGSGTSKTIIDNPIYSGLLTSCAGANNYNIVGYAGVAGTGYGVGRTLMKFPGLMSNSTFTGISAGQVTSLKLYLHEISGKSTSTTIYANLYTGAAWNETSTAYNNITWNGYGTQLNSQTFAAGTNAWRTFDLTSAVSTWKANSTTADKGIMLRNSNETADASRRDFRATENSSNKPYLILDYKAGVKAYRLKTGGQINCHGYASFTDDWPGRNSSPALWLTADQQYCLSTTYTINQCGAKTAAAYETWMRARNISFRPATSSTVLQSNEWRVVVRYGRAIIANEWVYDYHFWYQTDDGSWAQKGGSADSTKLSSTVTPESSNSGGWNMYYSNGSLAKTDFYTSTISYYALRQ